MAIKVNEEYSSRHIDRNEGTLEQRFTVTEAANLGEAETAVINYPFPSEDLTLADWVDAKVNVKVGYVFFDKYGPDNLNSFEATRVYQRRQTTDDDGIDWRLSMSASQVTTTTALSAISATDSFPFWTGDGEGSPINIKRNNGVNETVGMEIAMPTLKLTLGFIATASQWRNLRPKLLRLKRGTMNKTTFQGFNAGELLFSGFDSQRIENGEKYQVSYSFDVSPNGDYIAGDFTITDVKGWDAKWSYFGAEEEVTLPDGTITTRPKCTGAYASRVFDEADFNTLVPSSIVP